MVATMTSAGSVAPRRPHSSPSRARRRSEVRTSPSHSRTPSRGRASRRTRAASASEARPASCPADPGELGVGLVAAPPVEPLVVDRELHAAAAQEVRDRDREAGRHERRAHAHALHRAREELELDLVAGQALRDQLAAAELLAQDALDVGRGRREAVGLQDVRQHDPAAVVLGVEERVADGDRELVAQLGRAQRVADDEDVGHAVTPASWRRT